MTIEFEQSITAPPYDAVHDAPAVDQTAIFQQAADDLHVNGFTGARLVVPPGVYTVRGLTPRGGVRIIGAGRNVTTLSASGADASVVTPDAGSRYAGIEDMSVHGLMNQGASKATIDVPDNVPFEIKSVDAMFGFAGILTRGCDGLVFDSYVAGYSYCILSFGANRYIGNKIDNPGFPPGCEAAFAQGPTPAGISENQFLACDFSGSFNYSIDINDGGQHGAWVVVSGGSVLGRPWKVFSGKYLGISSSRVGDGNNGDAQSIVCGSMLEAPGAAIWTGPNVVLDATCVNVVGQ